MEPESVPELSGPQRSHSKIWKIALAIILLVVILLSVGYVLKNKAGERSSEIRQTNAGEGGISRSSSSRSEQQNCDASPIFSKDITDLSNINYLSPLGGLNVGTASRSYITNKKGADGLSIYTPIYAPMDSTLYGIYYKKANYGDKGIRGEYRLEIDAGCGISYVFDHIAEVNDTIKNAGAKEPSEQSNVGTNVSISLKAGDLLGRTDGTKTAGSWDFYLINPKKEVYHINPVRWQSDHNKHADCPYNYFSDNLKDKYTAKLALWDGQKPAGISCGQVSHDVAGSLSGGWFKGGSTDMKGDKLQVGTNFTMLEVLYGPEEQSQSFGFRTYSFSKKPEEVKAGEVVCYSGNGKYIYLNLLTESKLQMAKGNGSCPAAFPASGAEEWER